jgi:hypothetical protein
MENISLGFKLEMLVPTLQVYKEYFDKKYPCKTEENDGDYMPIEDELKWITYNWLLSTYENFKDISVEAYNKFQKKVSEIEVQ